MKSGWTKTINRYSKVMKPRAYKTRKNDKPVSQNLATCSLSAEAKEYDVYCGEQAFGIYEYNGFRFAKISFYEGFDVGKMSEHMDAFNKMEIRHDDVIVMTYPKCGTHLLREVAHMLQVGKTEYIGADMLDAPMEYRDQNEMSSLQAPRILHTHLPFNMLPKQVKDDRRCKVIALFRNPKDVIVSFWKFAGKMSKFPLPLDAFVDLLIKGEFFCNSWYGWRTSLVEGRKEYGDFPLLALKYEDCIENLKFEVEKIAKFLDKNVTEEFIDEIVKASDITRMREGKIKREPKDVAKLTDEGYKIFYRKGRVGDWKEALPANVNDSIDKWIASQENDGYTEFPDYRDFYKDN